MKRFSLLMACVAMTFFVAISVYAEKGDKRGRRDRQKEMREECEERELDLQERREELQFQQRMREIKLERKRRQMIPQEACPRRGHGGFSGMRRPKGGCPMMKRHPRHLLFFLFPFMMAVFIVHILLAVWVYKDIRERNSDSGIWIVITFLTGMCGAAVYAIVRLGNDKK